MGSIWQPPSGGCVLKPGPVHQFDLAVKAATFGWLCVETRNQVIEELPLFAATFGWLCVETVLSGLTAPV